MSVTLAPAVTPKLGPTPLLVPVVQTYMLGDFMRAFGIDEHVIQLCQQGYTNGDFRGVEITGLCNGLPAERTTLLFKDVMRDASITLDTSSNVSITEQLSRRFAQSILTSVTTMRRQGLQITYSYLFSAKGNANRYDTLARYGLIPGTPADLPPGMAFRDIYSAHHKPTGAVLTHASLRRIG